MKISLIMPVYNAAKYVSEAIESILNQTYKDFELIIIDDCSTDNSMQIVSSYKDDRIKIIHNERNAGIAQSRNNGLKVAKGEYIALMDDDDISLPQRFEKQMNFLDSNPDFDFVGGRYQIIDKKGEVTSESGKALHNPLYIKASFFFRNIISNGEMMFRRSIISQYNIRYADNQLGMEDFRFWIECSKIGKFYMLDQVFLQHRIHDTSETHRNVCLHGEERNDRKKELMKYSFELSGIDLNAAALNEIHEVINKENCKDRMELLTFYRTLKEILNNEKIIALDCYKEMTIICRQYLQAQMPFVEDLWAE